MGSLSAFLAENAEYVENERFVASRRFKDDSGKPLDWEVRCITSTDDEELRKSCKKRVQMSGKRGLSTLETDYELYLGKLAATCTVFPNLNDAGLQNSYGVMGAEALLKKMLTPGEYARYVSKVQEVNGFDIPLGEAVEELKN